MKSLNAQQLATLDWVDNDSGNLNVEARAGTGKTTLLIAIVEHIVRSGKGMVFLGAYNKAIAGEIKARLEAFGVDWKDAEAGTLHAMGFRLCRAAWSKVTLDEKKVQRIIDNFGNQAGGFFARNCSTIRAGVSLAKQVGIGVVKHDDQGTWLEMFEHYGVNDLVADDTPYGLVAACQQVLEHSNMQLPRSVDFDDMVYGPLVSGLKVRYPYDWVLLDECQDVNATRRELALRLLAPNGRFIAVGDSYQSIYGFTGADSNAMELLRSRLNSAVLPLTVTYRCPKAVVKEAQQFVPDIVAHESAPEGAVQGLRLVLRDRKPEEVKAEDEFDCIEFQPTDAILCRNTAPLVSLAYVLIRRRITCRVEGRDIGISLRKLTERWKVTGLVQLEERLSGYLERERNKFMAKDEPMRAQQVEDKVMTLRTLIELCAREDKHSVSDLFALIDSMFSDSVPGSASARPMLTLSTVHKSKGREWDRVFILNRERYMPSKHARKDWELQQERNLCYVAVTRAKQTLVYLTVAKGE